MVSRGGSAAVPRSHHVEPMLPIIFPPPPPVAAVFHFRDRRPISADDRKKNAELVRRFAGGMCCDETARQEHRARASLAPVLRPDKAQPKRGTRMEKRQAGHGSGETGTIAVNPATPESFIVR